jgi:hypothetical protein
VLTKASRRVVRTCQGKKAMAGVHGNKAKTGRSDSRAKISHAKHIHIYIYICTRTNNFQEYSYLYMEDSHAYASDHNKTFLVYFQPFEQPTKKLRKNGLQPPNNFR